jgi:membrane protein DedA with SNARE-associated domain
MGNHPVYDLIGQYGVYAVFFLVMLEGDMTLLIAGVLAHSAFFGDYSFLQVLIWGTLGGVASDNLAYAAGRGFCKPVRRLRFYRVAQPRIERLTNKFGPASIFLSKYIYGLRWASCVFYGVGRMPYLRFLPLTFASCFIWVSVLSGAGYFFSGAITKLIGDYKRIGIILLIVVVIGIVGFYLAERLWLSKKVEDANADKIVEFEHVAQEKLHEFKEEIQERIHFKPHAQRQKETVKPGEDDGD